MIVFGDYVIVYLPDEFGNIFLCGKPERNRYRVCGLASVFVTYILFIEKLPV